jgi:hypothetical protein
MPSLLALASVWRHRCKIEEHMPRLVHAGPMGKEVLFRRQLPRMGATSSRSDGAAMVGGRRSNPPGTARERVCATVGRQATDAHQPHIFPSTSPHMCSLQFPMAQVPGNPLPPQSSNAGGALPEIGHCRYSTPEPARCRGPSLE